MELRRGGAKDIPSLQALEQRARSIYAALPELGFVATTPPISAERLAAGSMLIAETDGAPVGFALVQLLDETLYLANIAVAPEAARCGVGARLLRGVTTEAHSQNAAAVTLTTFRTPPWNGPWFRKHGFVIMPEDQIGPALLSVLRRHSTFLDMHTRETLWQPLGNNATSPMP